MRPAIHRSLLIIACLLAVALAYRATAQNQAPQAPFDLRASWAASYAVVLRSDLPTVGVNGANGRERGKAEIPIVVTEDGWKQAGSIGREPATGTLGRGEVMKIDQFHDSVQRVEIRLVSVEPHEIVRDPNKPERNRREIVATVLRFEHGPRDARLLDAYLRTFGTLEAARGYATSLAEPQPDHRFTIGVVRRDGILVPVASYDYGKWFSRWPVPATDRDVPITTDAVPVDWWGLEGPAADWLMWLPTGGMRPLKLLAPIGFDAHCMMNVGMRTDYQSATPPPPLEQHHYPKDGLATTGSIRIEPVEVTTATKPFWTIVENRLQRLQPPGVVGPNPGLKLEVLCVVTGRAPGTMSAYFEAARRYAADPPTKPNELPCGRVTFVSGFVFWDGKTADPVYTQTKMTDCTQWDVEFSRPLGVIRIDGRPVWILEVDRWGGESYELVDLGDRPGRVLLTVPGGWCNKLGN